MITVKTENYNHISQDFYNKTIASLDLNLIPCTCGHSGCLIRYAILVFHDRYDIPAKASDKERLEESEEVFEYLICVICPLSGEYEPGEPECGFLFPVFTDR